MLRISMLLSCIFMTNTALDDDRSNKQFAATAMTTAAAASMASTTTTTTTTTTFFSKRELSITNDFDRYAVTCYICVNVSDNPICNQFAIDRPCRPGETFCHTLHIMDSSGSSVLVNKKCTSEKECQRGKVGCVQIDAQTMCVSCCDQNYCNENVPTNATNAIFDDKISKMRMLAKNMFKEREKAMTTTIKDANQTTSGGDRRERRRNNLPLAILFLLPLSQTSSLSSTLLAVRCYFNGVIANTRLRLI